MAKINNLASEISKILKEYTNEVEQGIEETQDKIAKDSVKKLKANSPKLTGSYRKGWRVKTEGNKKIIHNEVTKIHIGAGKKKKIRNIDILGALSNLEGLSGEDIGIIDVQDGFAFVDILNGKGNTLLKKYKEIKVKGKIAKLSKAKK